MGLWKGNVYCVSGTLVVLITIIICFLRNVIKSRYNYWKERNVPYLQPTFPFGNFENILVSKKPPSIIFQEFYQHFSDLGVKYGGIYSLCTPTFLPIDPELMKCILTKDAAHFLARGFYANEKDQPISAHLFSLDGAKWKILRGKLTPSFTPSKMKDMYPIFQQYGDDLKTFIKNYASRRTPINLQSTVCKYTVDVIGSCVFGLECDCLKSDGENAMSTFGKRAVHETSKLIKNTFCFSFPNFARKIGIKVFSPETERFFKDIVRSTLEYRTTNNVERNDLFQTLIEMYERGKAGDTSEGLTLDEVTAQCLLFYIAGFDTSATALLFTFYELAQNRECQRKLKEEIRSMKEKFNGEISYEAVSELKYLDAVVTESLRLYPPFPTLFRKCTIPYQIPNTDVILEEGTSIVFALLGLQRDPNTYSHPNSFLPERYFRDDEANRHAYTFLPFGEGPKGCIGKKMGILQVKVGIIAVMSAFNLKIHPKTKLPLRYSSEMLMTPLDDIYLTVTEDN